MEYTEQDYDFYTFVDECMASEVGINELIINEALSTEKAISQITKAIKNNKYIGVYYNDGNKEDGFRLIEPLVLGKGFRGKSGKITHEDTYYLRAYVIKDSMEDEYVRDKFKKSTLKKIFTGKDKHYQSYSISDKKPYWRLFKVDKITKIKTMRKKFGRLRKDYNPDDKMMGEIIISVPKSKLNESKSFLT